jgi:putative membrane protein
VTAGTGETQPERTALAWQRTGLGVLAIGGLLGHGALTTQRPVFLAVGGVTALLGLGMLGGLAPARYRQVRRRLTTGEPVSAPGLLGAAAAVVVLAAVAAAIAVVALARG